MGRARSIGSALAMLGAAALVGKAAFGHAIGIDWSHIVLGVTLGMAGVGLSRSSLSAAVLSRGAAWLVFAPMTLASILIFATRRHAPFEIVGAAAFTGLALLLTRSALHTPEARETFAPRAFRRWLLAGSITTAAAGIASGFIALQASRHSPLAALELGALAASFLASSVAVVRMRAWGVLLGALTSVVLLASGILIRNGQEFPIYAVAAAPALLMYVLPIVIARLRGVPAETREALALAPARVVAPLPETTASPLRVQMTSTEEAEAEDAHSGPANATVSAAA